MRPVGPRGRWLLAAALYGLALGLRLAFLKGPLLDEEALHYAAARAWWASPPHIQPALVVGSDDGWRTPLFTLLLAPAAAFGLTGYRAWHAILASFLPLVGAACARRVGAGPWASGAAGVVLALHPTMVQWGARVVPDPLMATLALAGLAAWQARRPLASAGLLLAACWTQEAALLLVVGLLAAAVWSGRKAGSVRWFPLELDHMATALLACLALAPLPLAWAVLAHGETLPPAGGVPLTAALGSVGGLWGLPFLAAAAWSPRSRPWALAAFAVAIVQAAVRWAGLHGSAAAVLPLALTAVAVASGLAPLAAHAGSGVRSAARASSIILALVLAAIVLLPASVPAKAAATPGSPVLPSVAELAGGLRDDDGLGQALASLRPDQRDSVFAVDVPWTALEHPLGDHIGQVSWALTTLYAPVEGWAGVVEGTQATVLHSSDTPMGRALRATYSDCVQATPGEYLVIDPQGCEGRVDRLQAELASQHGPD